MKFILNWFGDLRCFPQASSVMQTGFSQALQFRNNFFFFYSVKIKSIPWPPEYSVSYCNDFQISTIA